MIDLPWPPSINQHWRAVNGRFILSKRGRTYRERVLYSLPPQFPLEGRLLVSIVAHPPDRRKRDLDNLLKPVLDALEHAKVFLDDGQIDDLRVVRADPEKPGRVSVLIEEL